MIAKSKSCPQNFDLTYNLHYITTEPFFEVAIESSPE